MAIQEVEGTKATGAAFAAATEFQWKVHAYINEYIRFADTKAAIVIAWTSGLMGAMYSIRAHERFLRFDAHPNESFAWAAFLAGGSAAAFLFLGAGFFAALKAIAPRLNPTELSADQKFIQRQRVYADPEVPQVIFFEQIKGHGSDESYWKSVAALNDEQRLSEVGRHCFVLSGLATKKFWWVNWGIRLAFYGSVAVASVILFLPGKAGS